MGEDNAAISCKATGNFKQETLAQAKKVSPGRAAKLCLRGPWLVRTAGACSSGWQVPGLHASGKDWSEGCHSSMQTHSPAFLLRGCTVMLGRGSALEESCSGME